MRRAEVLPASLLDHAENYFNQIRAVLDEEEENEFRLGWNGYIVVLEAGDNVHDLGNVGLCRENGGLLGSFPEYVELLDVGVSHQAYKVALLYDNDYLMRFFTLAQAVSFSNYGNGIFFMSNIGKQYNFLSFRKEKKLYP